MAGCAWLISYFNEMVKEGGYLGCIGVLAMFSTWMTWVALSKSLAVMLPTLQDQFGASTWLVGWIVAMVDGSVDLAGKSLTP